MPSISLWAPARRFRVKMLSQPQASLTGHADWIEDIAFSLEGNLLASASRDGIVRLWDVTRRKELWRYAAREGKELSREALIL